MHARTCSGALPAAGMHAGTACMAHLGEQVEERAVLAAAAHKDDLQRAVVLQVRCRRRHGLQRVAQAQCAAAGAG